MAARTVSELANWDGRLDQQRQHSDWRHSSSTLARDSYHIPLENQSFEVFQSSGMFLDPKRVEKSASRCNRERESLVNATENARPPGRVDTPSTSLSAMHHYHRPSISNSVTSPALSPSPFIASSKSSHSTPNSSILVSRVHNSRPPSREHATSLQPALTTGAEVIDLTIGDTEDERSVSEMLGPNSLHSSDRYPDPGPSHRPSFSQSSSPIVLERSLFTPPQLPRRHTSLFIDYVAVPSFPKGLTKADYRPMSGHSAVPLPGHTGTRTLKGSSLAKLLVNKERTPPRKWKGKEREHDTVSAPKHKRCTPEADAAPPSASLDAFLEHTMIPLHDEHTYPPLTPLDLATNSRFQFVHLWREYASRLREAELGWTFEVSLFGQACIWVRSVDSSSPRIPGTTGYVSSEQLRSWELVPPHETSQEKSSNHVSDEQADATGHSVAEFDGDCLLLPDDALLDPTVTFDPALSNSPLSQSLSSVAVDMEHDMSQYFNGLSDSPNKHVPRSQPTLPHTFDPHLLQTTGHAQMDPFGLGFPSLKFDTRLADTGSHECFLGVPPSPTIADIESSMAPGPAPDSPFEPMNDFTASSSNLCTADVSFTDGWSYEQGEDFLQDNGSSSSSHVPVAGPSTIDPSLLGLEQRQAPSRLPKGTSSKRRSKLPEPVIYIRRPTDSSRLPLVSGKRPVQIKYRDPEGAPTAPLTQSVSKQISSSPVEHPIELPANDTHESPQTKEPTLREHHDSDSDYIPQTSKPSFKAKAETKQPSGKGKKVAASRQGKDVSALSFCHQCRNRSSRPKMLCSNNVDGRVCGKRFCNRCILYRYPDITFDEHSASFLCPACTNTCNCSFCSRNRGEEFVSMRLGGLAASVFKAKVTLVRDFDKPSHRPRSPQKDKDVNAPTRTRRDEPGALPVQSHFWAHVYGMEGQRMGSAFMTREHMDRLNTRGPSPPPLLPKPQPHSKTLKPRRREKKGPRVFIGHPLQSWKVRGVRDLEPNLDARTEKGQGSSSAALPSRRRRSYVGDPTALYEPYGRMLASPAPSPTLTPTFSRCSTPGFDSDERSLSPLSELEMMDDWPQPEVGEWCSWVPTQPPLPLPPGTVVSTCASDPFQSTRELCGLPGGVGAEVVGREGPGSGVMDVDERVSGSTTTTTIRALSEEDLARAISAALAALSVPDA